MTRAIDGVAPPVERYDGGRHPPRVTAAVGRSRSCVPPRRDRFLDGFLDGFSEGFLDGIFDGFPGGSETHNAALAEYDR